MSDISPSSITTDAEFEKQIAGADFETIKTLMAQRAVEQHLVVPDRYDPSVLLPVAPGTAPRGFAKTVTINGVKHILEGTTETELLQAESALYREAMSQPAATTTTEQPRNERGQFTAADQTAEAERQASLTLRMQLGQITTAEYLEQSGAIDSYLSERGVDLPALQEVSSKKFEESWADATSSFIARHGEWPGGDANRDILGKLLVENNLTDSDDKLAAMEAAYNFARENNLLVENEAVVTRDKIASANSPEEIRLALGRSSSGFFGR